jgi:hypothetical protein
MSRRNPLGKGLLEDAKPRSLADGKPLEGWAACTSTFQA